MVQENIKQNTVALNEIKRLLNNIYEQQEKKSSVLENRLSLLEENQQKLYLDGSLTSLGILRRMPDI